MDELEYMRKPSEAILWKSGAIGWRLMLILPAGAVFLDGLVNGFDWPILVVTWIKFTLALFAIAFATRSRSEVTEGRILHLGRGRDFRGDALAGVHVIPLAEISHVALRDNGLAASVEVHLKDCGRSEVLRSNRPSEFADAIADAAGCARAPGIGRLWRVAGYCLLLGAAIVWPFRIMVVEGAIDLAVAVPGGLEVCIAAAVLSLLLAVLVIAKVLAVVAFLLLPLFATAEEVENWLRLTPNSRLLRWFGWKGRPYRWLAGLAFGRTMDDSARGSA